MAWGGYGLYAGNEIYNSARVRAYAGSQSWFRGCWEDELLPLMLGDGPEYKTPLLDDAPWTEQEYPESYDFYGFYPLDVTGIEDSTRSSTVTESTLDGGIPGRVRHSTKSVVFNGVLLGATEAAVEYGMRWLRRALLPGPCGGPAVSNCLGDDFCYLSSPPCMGDYETDPIQDDEFSDAFSFAFDPMAEPSVVQEPPPSPTACLDDYWRTLKKFAVINGPTITAKRTMSDGCGTMWSVTFTGVAGTPWEFGREIPIIEGFDLQNQVGSPYVSEIEGEYDVEGVVVTDSNCAVQEWLPLQDPDCPALIPPPGPTNIPRGPSYIPTVCNPKPPTPASVDLGCFVPPENWLRRAITIPEEYIPLWDSVAPVIDVHAVKGDLRNLRIRFFADPYETNPAVAVDDGCAYCGDILISYVPQDYTLTFDGAEQRVYATAPGGQMMRADSLVFATDGTPFIWPELSCGFGYVVTFDLPQTQIAPVVDLSLIPRSA